MAAIGWFEPEPRLAAAVSGGPDSMALALLAHAWARAAGGSVLALVVDHGLRPEAAREAAATTRRLADRGIPARILPWRPDPVPATAVEEAARKARHHLLEEACRAEGILHLLLGHTADDQAETLLLRLASGSGPDGLAGMPAVREGAHGRLLRPLLGWTRAATLATCRAAGLEVALDPTNRDPRFARARLRRGRAVLEREGLTARRLAATAARAGQARAALEAATARLLAEAAEPTPDGLAVDRARLAAAPFDLAARGLARGLALVGRREDPPRAERLHRLLAALRGPAPFAGRTLAGCRLRERRGRVLLTPEADPRTWLTQGPGEAAAPGRPLCPAPFGVA
jgi:tRNA(Ile)-lysidine synthase